MPKLFSSKEVEYVLKRLEFRFITQKGSHGKFKNKEGRIAILPMNKKEIPQGTLRSILRQSGINYEEFMKILENWKEKVLWKFGEFLQFNADTWQTGKSMI